MPHSPDETVQLVFRSRLSGAAKNSRIAALIAEWEGLHARLGLTGLLIRFDSTFVGVIEGPRAAALARLETLSARSVLDGLIILREAEIRSRRFETSRFQDIRSADGDTMLQVTGGLFAQRLSRELHKRK